MGHYLQMSTHWCAHYHNQSVSYPCSLRMGHKTKQKRVNMETGPVEDRAAGWKGEKGGGAIRMHCVIYQIVKEKWSFN